MRYRISKLLAALICTVSLTFATAGNADTLEESASWTRVDLALDPHRVLDEESGVPPSVKVGEGYKFKFFDRRQQALQAAKVFWNTREVGAQKVMVVYRLNELDRDDLVAIVEGSAGAPPDASFVTSSSDESERGAFYGVPVKWNREFAEVFRAAIRIEDTLPGIEANEVMTVVGADLIAKATTKSALKRVEAVANEDIGSDLMRQHLAELNEGAITLNRHVEWTEEEVSLLSQGDPAPLMMNSPNETVYIAFDQQVEGVEAAPVGRIISVAGAWGGRLGYDVAPWPNDR